jgi:hypothetical protein
VKKSKILIVVAHGLYEPWVNILHEGQRKTWLRWPLPEEVKVIHLHGTPLSPIGWKLDRLHEKIRWTNKWVARPLAWLDRFLLLPFRWYIPKISTPCSLSGFLFKFPLEVPSSSKILS